METALKLKKKNKKGFTLVELVIVIAVLAILAAIAVPTVTNIIDTANRNVDIANAQSIELALKSADAEIQSKTWDGKFAPGDTALTHDTLTVADALKHEGLSLVTPRSSATYTYKEGKVYCDSDHTSANATALDGTKLVKDVIAA